MTSPPDLLKAIRSGNLSGVCAALDAGATLDGDGEPGLLMGMACFLGHVAIVRELAGRGATVDFPDNALPTSPLSMAVRGGRTEVVRALIELGVEVPAGMQTGLSEQELTVARWIAFRDGHAKPDELDDPTGLVEEIEVHRHGQTDTQILEADILREIRNRS